LELKVCLAHFWTSVNMNLLRINLLRWSWSFIKTVVDIQQWIIFQSAILVIMKYQRWEQIKNVSSWSQVKHFQSLQIIKEIWLSINHVQHALVNNLKLLLDLFHNTLVYSQVNRYVDFTFICLILFRFHLNFLAFICVIFEYIIQFFTYVEI
jgi:hypothetical protein